MKGVEKMEFEVVEVKVPKGFVPREHELIICVPEPGDMVLGGSIVVRLGCSLIARRKRIKPDWKPPKLKSGWVTWDELGGWYWWENRPEYHAVDSWTYPQSGDVFENEEIGLVMAEILGCPDCSGFDERNCIWEVGE